MSKLGLYFLMITSIVFIGCDNSGTNQAETPKKWYKGNLHTHSYWSDGDEFPEVILDWYKKKGYNFAALSDHNILAQDEKWKTLPSDSIHQKAFQDYLAHYGEDWIEYKIDTGAVSVLLKTYEQYRDLTEEPGKFLIIRSEEITDGFEGKPIHMNATNIQKLIGPKGGSSVAETIQNNLDQVIAQRKETGVPIMQHLNHPNFGYGVSLNDIIALNGERFFEVYNGHPSVHNMRDSTHISTEEMWDLANIAYLKVGKPLLYGLATDDSHHYHNKGKQWSNAGRGWVMVQTDTLTASSLINAMETGSFYASTGVTLKNVDLNDNVLTIAVEPEEGIVYNIIFMGCNKAESETVVLKSIAGTEAQFELTDELLFVRCKIVSSKLQENPIEDLIYETAWTQPLTPKE